MRLRNCCAVALGVSMAVTEATALYNALAMLTQQVQIMAEQGSQRGAKDLEEYSVKLRSLVAAADINVNKLMKSVEAACAEEQLAKGLYKELTPDFTEGDSDFIVKTSAEMYHVLLNITTG